MKRGFERLNDEGSIRCGHCHGYACRPPVAQAKTYRLYYCGHQSGHNYYKVMAPLPACSFGKAAYNPMMSFGLSGRQRGHVRVGYRGRNYTLGCFLTSYGEDVQCGRGGVP